jgi:hypothetical protein
MIPVMHLQNNQTSGELSYETREATYSINPKTFRSRLLLVERAMAAFLDQPNSTFSTDKEHSQFQVKAEV